MDKISVYDNKYIFVLENTPKGQVFRCERYGEQWRDFVGDGAVLQLFLYCLDLQAENEQLEALCWRESQVLKEALKRKQNIKSMIAVVADSLERTSPTGETPILKRLKELIDRHRICTICGKQLSQAESDSVHSCYDEQALREKGK